MPRRANPRATLGDGSCKRSAQRASESDDNTILFCIACNASAAAPNSPETQMSSPTLAPSRRRACAGATSPMICTQMFNGPAVVSPPISSTLYSSASEKKPREKCSSHVSSTVGKANASVAQRGLAAIAAMSERFTANDFRPSKYGSTSEKKCRPDTNMSVEIANDIPGVRSISAASSPTPNNA